MTRHQLAQLNIAQARAEMDADLMSGFTARIDEINRLAESAPGFVWRLQDEQGDATALRVFNDPLMLVNMSIWESLEALQDYVYQSLHVELMKERKDWFHKMGEVHQVLWWVPAGHIPGIEEAKMRLEQIRSQGPCREAFSFARPFPPE